MEQMTLTEFRDYLRTTQAGEIAREQCIEVSANYTHLGFFIIGSIGEMRNRFQSLASQVDAAKPPKVAIIA